MWERWRMPDGESRGNRKFCGWEMGLTRLLKNCFKTGFSPKAEVLRKVGGGGGWRRGGGGLEKATGEEEGEDILERQFQRGVSLQGWRVLEDA